jgi:hypothetical protein
MFEIVQENEKIPKQKHMKKFSVEEDEMLKQLVQTFGTNNWSKISSKMNKRSNRQCKIRWNCVLCPQINRREWSNEEKMHLLSLVKEHGKYWNLISRCMINRPVNQCKNQYFRLEKSLRNIQFRQQNTIIENIPNEQREQEQEQEQQQQQLQDLEEELNSYSDNLFTFNDDCYPSTIFDFDY